jgi:hypothetical protein
MEEENLQIVFLESLYNTLIQQETLGIQATMAFNLRGDKFSVFDIMGLERRILPLYFNSTISCSYFVILFLFVICRDASESLSRDTVLVRLRKS